MDIRVIKGDLCLRSAIFFLLTVEMPLDIYSKVRGNESQHESMHHFINVSSGSLDSHKASKSCLLGFSFYIVCDRFTVFYSNSFFSPMHQHLFFNFFLSSYLQVQTAEYPLNSTQQYSNLLNCRCPTNHKVSSVVKSQHTGC